MAHKIVFLTGTRADYGKLKSLMRQLSNNNMFQVYVYVTGMHLLEQYGNTWKEVKKDGYANIYVEDPKTVDSRMDVNLANVVLGFSKYVGGIKPDYIVIHGDRTDAFAGAIVGLLNNIKVIHIEGGELTGTVDDSIRHAITKLAHIHCTANEETKLRLIQLGEQEEKIHIIGSPDVDIMVSGDLPELVDIKQEYGITYEKYGILTYHPVVTESTDIKRKFGEVFKAVLDSQRNYIIIYPNNDLGSDTIIDLYVKSEGKYENLFFQKSFPFETFLVLLKNADFIIGNSSAGIREACVYGVPCIDIGSRQAGRYNPRVLRNICHVEEQYDAIRKAIEKAKEYRVKSRYFGLGNSAELFEQAVVEEIKADTKIQKCFVDTEETQKKLQKYINEVLF